MAQVPYPIPEGDDIQAIKHWVYEINRNVFENKIGGLDIGDVFSNGGDYLQLDLATSSGLTKTGGVLAISCGTGISINASNQLEASTDITLDADGGLQKTGTEYGIKLDGSSLVLSSSGIKVGQSALIGDPSGGATQDAEARTAIVAILDLLIARGLMAST